MAPGILPLASSALKKSSMRDSFSTDSVALWDGPNWAAAVGIASAIELATRIAANSALSLRGYIDCSPLPRVQRIVEGKDTAPIPVSFGSCANVDAPILGNKSSEDYAKTAAI